MKLHRRPLVCALLLLAACNQSPIVLKVTQTGSDGTMRYSIPIRIGDSAAKDVFFDTGSSGLRVLQGAVLDSAFTDITKTSLEYSYHSGLVLTGVVAHAKISIGSFTTANSIAVMLVQAVSCTAALPNCPAKGKTVADISLFGGYAAVFGVSLQNKENTQEQCTATTNDECVASPLAQLAGVSQFIVHSPAYGGTVGTLNLAPTESELQPFKTYSLPSLTNGVTLPNGTPAYDDRFGLPACVHDKTAGVDYCVPAELDSGNPPIYIEWPAYWGATVQPLPSGHEIVVDVGPDAAPLAQYEFTIAAKPIPGIDLVEREAASGAGFMNLGTGLFFRYDVLYVPARGAIGLAPH